MKTKTYRVKLNWQGEIHEMHTSAKSSCEALSQACYRLAKSLKRRGYSIHMYFLDGKKDNWKVEEIKEKSNGKDI